MITSIKKLQIAGPLTWHKEFPVAEEGKRQSPIDIKTDDVVDDEATSKENPLKWEYTDKHCLSVENTGSSWRVNIDGTGSSKCLPYTVNSQIQSGTLLRI